MTTCGHYRVHVDGGNPLFLPPFRELNGDGACRFDQAGTPFSGDYEWTLHKSIRDSGASPGPRDFLLKQFESRVFDWDVADWAGNNGYQVCTPAERFAFAKAHPDLQRRFPIADIGSSTMDGRECIATLFATPRGRRVLGTTWADKRRDPHWRFLLRKQKLIPAASA